MEVEQVEYGKIVITFSVGKGDEYYAHTSISGFERHGMGETYLSLPLDRAIELRDKLSKIIDSEVSKLNSELNPVKVG